MLTKSNLEILSSYVKNYRKLDFYSTLFLKEFISYFWASYYVPDYSNTYKFVKLPLIILIKHMIRFFD